MQNSGHSACEVFGAGEMDISTLEGSLVACFAAALAVATSLGASPGFCLLAVTLGLVSVMDTVPKVVPSPPLSCLLWRRTKGAGG